MKRAIGLVVLLLVGAALGAAGWSYWQDRQDPERALPRLYGNVEIRDALLSFFGEQRIAELLVEEGDLIQKGQLLGRLHTDRLEAEIAQAEARIAGQEAVVQRLENGTRPQEIGQARAEVAAAEARVGNAERVLQRRLNTVESGASSEQDVDNARAQLDVERAALAARREALSLAIEGPRKEDIAQAQAQLRQFRADLTLLQRRLADAELYAPDAGTIQSRLLEPGEMASPSRPVFNLALHTPKWVRAYVSEPDLGLVKSGMRAVVMSDSFPDRRYEGWIGFISPQAEFTPKSVETTDLRTKLVYEVRVYVTDSHNELRLGMPVTVLLRADLPSSAPAQGGPSATAPFDRGP